MKYFLRVTGWTFAPNEQSEKSILKKLWQTQQSMQEFSDCGNIWQKLFLKSLVPHGRHSRVAGYDVLPTLG